MRNRWCLAAACAVGKLLGCRETPLEAVRVLGVEPTTVSQSSPAPVRVMGAGFQRRWHLDLDSDEPPMPSLGVSVRVANEELPASAVEVLDATRLRIQLEPDFMAGRHDVGVRRGTAPWVVLPKALFVQPSTRLTDAGGGAAGATGSDGGRVTEGLDASTPPADAGAPPRCDPAQTDLIACFEFEDGAGATRLTDGSRYGNHAVVSNALFAAGVHGYALQGSSAFDSFIADSASLDADTELTIEAWIQPDASVTSGRQGILDNQNQYGLFIVAQDALRCILDTDRLVDSPNRVVEPGRWQHVACAYDGSAIGLYVDGSLVAESAAAGSLPTDASVGAALAQDSPDGSELIGKMDTLRIWSSARSRAEICAAAGQLCP